MRIKFIENWNNSFGSVEEENTSYNGGYEIVKLSYDGEKLLDDEFFSQSPRRAEITLRLTDNDIGYSLLKEFLYSNPEREISAEVEDENLISNVSKTFIQIINDKNGLGNLMFTGICDKSQSMFTQKSKELKIVCFDMIFLIKSMGEQLITVVSDAYSYKVIEGKSYFQFELLDKITALSGVIFNYDLSAFDDIYIKNNTMGSYGLVNTPIVNEYNSTCIENFHTDVSPGDIPILYGYSGELNYEDVNAYIDDENNIVIYGFFKCLEVPYKRENTLVGEYAGATYYYGIAWHRKDPITGVGELNYKVLPKYDTGTKYRSIEIVVNDYDAGKQAIEKNISNTWGERTSEFDETAPYLINIIKKVEYRVGKDIYYKYITFKASFDYIIKSTAESRSKNSKNDSLAWLYEKYKPAGGSLSRNNAGNISAYTVSFVRDQSYLIKTRLNGFDFWVTQNSKLFKMSEIEERRYSGSFPLVPNTYKRIDVLKAILILNKLYLYCTNDGKISFNNKTLDLNESESFTEIDVNNIINVKIKQIDRNENFEAINNIWYDYATNGKLFDNLNEKLSSEYAGFLSEKNRAEISGEVILDDLSYEDFRTLKNIKFTDSFNIKHYMLVMESKLNNSGTSCTIKCIQYAMGA